MTEEEYLRMKNILSTVIEQQAGMSERHAKAEARMDRNDEAIAALLTIAQIHEREITQANEQMSGGFDRINARFEQIATTFQDLAKKTAETDERINALVNVVERYISKN
jgi:outer membrane murein-binding lipoprotein Lpp